MSEKRSSVSKSQWMLRYNLAKAERRRLRALSKRDRLVVFKELEKISLEGGVLKGRTVQELLMRRHGQCDYACASQGCHGTPGICVAEMLAAIDAMEVRK